jgi:hypothetical protein
MRFHEAVDTRLLPVAISMIDLANLLRSRGLWGSFCVALRFEPSNLSVAGHPIVNVSFADEAADNPNFRARDTGLNLPVSFSDPFWLECDARGFFHPDNMALKPDDS